MDLAELRKVSTTVIGDSYWILSRQVVVYDGYRAGDETILHFWSVLLHYTAVLYRHTAQGRPAGLLGLPVHHH